MNRPNKLDYTTLPENPREPERPEYLEIDTGRKKRLLGWAGYILFFLAVCSVLVLLFIKFTSSYRLAVGLVGFMVAYMTLMGWFASRNWERRD
jgi:hypothetical protein